MMASDGTPPNFSYSRAPNTIRSSYHVDPRAHAVQAAYEPEEELRPPQTGGGYYPSVVDSQYANEQEYREPPPGRKQSAWKKALGAVGSTLGYAGNIAAYMGMGMATNAVTKYIGGRMASGIGSGGSAGSVGSAFRTGRNVKFAMPSRHP